MNIRITQLDGSLPNIALMRLSHHYKSHNHNVFFEPGINKDLFEPDYDHVYASAIFTSSEKKITLFKNQFPNAVVGGTGTGNLDITIESLVNASDDLDYSIYPEFESSIGFTQRGCRLRCGFCVVPRKEGKINSPRTIADIYRGGSHPKQLVLLDNDFFGQPNWMERSEEIISGDFKVNFNQGINIRLIHPDGAAALSKMKYYNSRFDKRRIYTAWDNRRDEEIFFRGVNMLMDAGIRPDHIMVYMLCGYWPGETFDDVYYRFKKMIEIGLMPYPMVYGNNPLLKKFQRWVVGRYHQFISWEEYRK